MPLPVASILKALTALGSAVGVYLARQKQEKIDAPREDTGKIIADLQADAQRQTVFIGALTKELQALTLQVQKQQKAQFWLTLFLSILGVLTFLLLVMTLLEASSVR